MAVQKKKKKYLSAEDRAQMDINHVEERARRLEMSLMRTLVAKARLEIEVRECKVRELLHEQRQVQDRVEAARDKHKKWTVSLRKKYSIENENWGFNPDTNEIDPDPDESDEPTK